jgi:Na+/H+-dicarboxylate symporter
MKSINVIFLLMAIVLTWLTEAKQEDKIFLTIFFSIAIGFWLMAMVNDDKEELPPAPDMEEAMNNLTV